jgi:hypothetical protein
MISNYVSTVKPGATLDLTGKTPVATPPIPTAGLFSPTFTVTSGMTSTGSFNDLSKFTPWPNPRVPTIVVGPLIDTTYGGYLNPYTNIYEVPTFPVTGGP